MICIEILYLIFINYYLDVAKEQNDALEEQRAYASIGRTYLTKGINDPDNIDIPTLKQASKAFMKSLMICERFVIQQMFHYVIEILIR